MSRLKTCLTTFIFLALLLASGCENSNSSQQLSDKDFLIERAAKISQALYSNDDTLKQYLSSNEEKNKYLVETQEKNKNLKIIQLKMHAYNENSDGTITVTNQLVDSSDGDYFYHEFIFKKDADKWVLYDFGIGK